MKRHAYKVIHWLLSALWLSVIITQSALSQGFSSGSTGAYGPLNVTSNTTLNLPPDGIFNCTTIRIAPSVTLTFNRNALNTPVYLLATSNVTINGTIDVGGQVGSAAGGPGGFDGGYGGLNAITPPGAGYGPGGGKGGDASNQSSGVGGGSYATVGTASSTNNGATYGGALLVPLVGGSGGGGT